MKSYLSILCLLCSFALLSCGENKKEEKSTIYETEVSEKAATPAKEEETSGNSVTIHADDLMKFDTKEIKVKAGEKVTLTLTHVGKLDKKVMGHNWVLLKKGVDLVDFATAATTASKTDYIPEGTEDIIAHTKLIGGGESDTIEFDAPEPGVYEFLCSFPGHFAMMQGKFIVE